MTPFHFEDQFLQKYRNGFCDLGCSAGGSINYLSKKFKTVGFGIDIDEAKLEAARNSGFEALNIDLFENALPKNMVAFTSMFHVLEHLHSEAQTRAFLQQAVAMSRKFVLVRHPYFDADPILARHGLKFYFADWSGHTNHLTSYNLFKLMQRIKSPKILDVSIYGRQPIEGVTDVIVPITAPINTTRDMAKEYDPVDVSRFDTQLYRETAMIIRLEAGANTSVAALEQRMKLRPEDRLLFQDRRLH